MTLLISSGEFSCFFWSPLILSNSVWYSDTLFPVRHEFIPGDSTATVQAADAREKSTPVFPW